MLDLIQQASDLAAKGRRDAAADIFNRIADMATADAEEIVARGRLALLLNENIYALESFSRARELAPDNTFYTYLLANACARTGKTDQAGELCREVIARDPHHHQPYLVLGKIAFAYRNYPEAVEQLKQAVALAPGDPASYTDLIYSLRVLGRHKEALEYAKELLRLEPSANNHIPIARVYIEMGESEKAAPYLEKAVSLDSACGRAYIELATINKFTPDDSEFIEQAEKALEQDMPVVERLLVHHSLGKAYDDCRQWDNAFEHYSRANRLAKSDVEPALEYELYKSAKKAYTKSFLKKPEPKGSDSAQPVFIVGMPRSGTTLLEQILAGHPGVDGAGELLTIPQIREKIFAGEKWSAGQLESALTSRVLADSAQEYLAALQSGKGDVDRIVDKLPHNFANLGLIYKLFPNSHIIHAMRHPLDTCLSCYFQPMPQFVAGTDLHWVGKAFRLYMDFMEFWKQVLPEGTILDVRYEDVVADIEHESRRLIDFIGLAWDESCLDFYKRKKGVATASAWQVRQPVYSSSKGRWVHYARYLGELAREVSEYLDDEDIEILARNGVKIRKKWGLNKMIKGI